jgi:lactoylglutathione lyase
MKYLHTMIRIKNIEESLNFFCNKLGLVEIRRKEVPEGKFTLIFLAAPEDENNAIETRSPEIELTYNWDPENYDKGRNFGHLAFSVKNIYETCQKLMDSGVTINRPPREGRMAFVKSPDNISIELLQQGENLPISEPWASMKNIGSW